MERNLYYVTAGSDDYVINLVKDLSAINGQNFEHTTRKGVPLVYDVTVTCASAGNATCVSAFQTVRETWMYRNAAVKLHFARLEMFERMGVSIDDLGRYGKTIRYHWHDEFEATEGGSPAWTPMVSKYPSPGGGGTTSDVTGGEWDYSRFFTDTDTGGFWAHLIGKHDPISVEETNTYYSMNSLSLVPYYLNSRNKIQQDSPGKTQADHNIHDQLMMLGGLGSAGSLVHDEVTVRAEAEQDQPPYMAQGEPHFTDFTPPSFKAAVVTSANQGLVNSVRFEAPFGFIGSKYTIGASDQQEYNIRVNGVREMIG